VWPGQGAYAARDGADSGVGLDRWDTGGVVVQADNGGDNREADNGGDNNEGDNSDNAAADNSDNMGGDNGDANANPIPPPLPRPTAPPQPTCSTPGQDTTFTWGGGRIAVRVPGSTTESVRIAAYQVENPYAAPAPPGTPVYTLMYEIRATACDMAPLAELPAEVELAVHYTDLEIEGLDERRLQIGHFDTDTATWVPLEQQASDPATNAIIATVRHTGFYWVWETF
jgi:hypothetical protein